MSRHPRPDAPLPVRWIARTLEKAGHETWAVGGAVRDVFLGLESGDWDLATHARPEQVRAIFRRTVPIGVEHGTVGVLSRDGTLYEVTTFRRDVETDGRHAVVTFAETIEEDLARRDFTVNALAWHPLREELRDPFQGVRDAERRILRTVGEPDERFAEDYLRILRALRFAGRFELEIEGATWASLARLVDNVRLLSAERVRDELLKILESDPAPERALELYAESGALAVLYPELAALRAGAVSAAGGGRERAVSGSAASAEAARGGEGSGEPAARPARAPATDPDPWRLSVATAAALPPGRPLSRLAALLRCLSREEAAALLVRLRLSRAQTDETAYRAAAPALPDPAADDAAFRRWLSASGSGRLVALARLDLARARAECALGLGDRIERVVASWRRARRVRASAPPLSVEELALDGRGLIALGLEPGPEFGRILDDLLDWVLEDPSRNERAALSERALRLAGAVRDG
jgi:tRNA nucleotidyltransferase (CCA-adding enzyme)